jgi:protein required for attachment to host cells
MKTRVVVADNSRARIFSSYPHFRELCEQEDFVHEAAHLSNQELVADAAGKSVDQHGSLDPATSAKVHEKAMFAKALAKHLKKLHNHDHYKKLVLVAPPKFLGLLRGELHSTLDKLVIKTLDKDLTLCSIDELIEHLTK